MSEQLKKTLDELIDDLGKKDRKARAEMMKSFFYAQHLEDIRAMDEAYYREQEEASK